MDEEKKGFFAFLSKNFDAISKLFVYHIAMCVFGLVVVLAVQILTEQLKGDKEIPLGVPAYIACGVAILVYLGLIYVCMWEKGASDRIKILGGRMKRNNFKGLLLWLVANSVDVLIILCVMILSFIPAAEGVHAVFSLISLLLNAMYLPILTVTSNISWIYFIVLIPGAVMALISYILGVSGYKCIFPEPKGEKNRKLK